MLFCKFCQQNVDWNCVDLWKTKINKKRNSCHLKRKKLTSRKNGRALIQCSCYYNCKYAPLHIFIEYAASCLGPVASWHTVRAKSAHVRIRIPSLLPVPRLHFYKWCTWRRATTPSTVASFCLRLPLPSACTGPGRTISPSEPLTGLEKVVTLVNETHGIRY